MGVRTIRFHPDCVDWISRKEKATTFRATRRNGVYELIKGSWFKPHRQFVFYKISPIDYISKEELIHNHFNTEGPFKTSDEFWDWLVEVGLLTKLPSWGWLNKVEPFVGGLTELSRIEVERRG